VGRSEQDPTNQHQTGAAIALRPGSPRVVPRSWLQSDAPPPATKALTWRCPGALQRMNGSLNQALRAPGTAARTQVRHGAHHTPQRVSPGLAVRYKVRTSSSAGDLRGCRAVSAHPRSGSRARKQRVASTPGTDPSPFETRTPSIQRPPLGGDRVTGNRPHSPRVCPWPSARPASRQSPSSVASERSSTQTPIPGNQRTRPRRQQPSLL